MIMNEMKPWDGKVRDGHSIAFDGKNFYDIPPPDGGYGPYKVWNGSEYIALITNTQYKFMNDVTFWMYRYDAQLDYIAELADRNFEWSGRMQQLLESAFEVLELIRDRILKLDKNG